VARENASAGPGFACSARERSALNGLRRFPRRQKCSPPAPASELYVPARRRSGSAARRTSDGWFAPADGPKAFGAYHTFGQGQGGDGPTPRSHGTSRRAKTAAKNAFYVRVVEFQNGRAPRTAGGGGWDAGETSLRRAGHDLLRARIVAAGQQGPPFTGGRHSGTGGRGRTMVKSKTRTPST